MDLHIKKFWKFDLPITGWQLRRWSCKTRITEYALRSLYF